MSHSLPGVVLLLLKVSGGIRISQSYVLALVQLSALVLGVILRPLLKTGHDC